MPARPEVKPGDWIKVGNIHCAVANVRPPELVAHSGNIEVVFDAQKPTNHDVEWTGEAWVFCKRPDFGGYAERYSRLSTAVAQLKRGRWAK